MTKAAEPTFNTNEQASTTRVEDHLLIAFPPAVEGGVVIFERMALTTELGGFAPNRNVVRKDAYQEADGKEISLVAIIGAGGNIQFSVASKGPQRDRLLAAAVKGRTVLYKANYASANVQVWGATKLVDRGIQGGRDDIPDWGFTCEASTAQYVDKDGNVIG